jgi:hypothetical protein
MDHIVSTDRRYTEGISVIEQTLGVGYYLKMCRSCCTSESPGKSAVLVVSSAVIDEQVQHVKM